MSGYLKYLTVYRVRLAAGETYETGKCGITKIELVEISTDVAFNKSVQIYRGEEMAIEAPFVSCLAVYFEKPPPRPSLRDLMRPRSAAPKGGW